MVSIPRPIKGVKRVLAIASGKGGVGKSTIAINIALSLAKMNKQIGILDADIFGPSLPTLINKRGHLVTFGYRHSSKDYSSSPSPSNSINDHETKIKEQEQKMERIINPLIVNNIKCMSMGFLIPEGSPIVWRGLMVMKALEQMIRQVDWSPLDYLIIDMPPGTGDIQLTLSQNLLIDGVVLISTPQQLSFDDVQRAGKMFDIVNVPILGMVINMNGFKCPCCGTSTEILPNKQDSFLPPSTTLLGKWNILERIPIDPLLSSKCDDGSLLSESKIELKSQSKVVANSQLYNYETIFNSLALKINDRLSF